MESKGAEVSHFAFVFLSRTVAFHFWCLKP